MSPSEGLEIEINEHGGTTVIAPRGDIDMNVSPVLRASLKPRVVAARARIVVDLAGVPYMDSSGLATLVEAMKDIRAHNGAMILCNMGDRVRGIFEIARLDQYFSIHITLEDALAAL